MLLAVGGRRVVTEVMDLAGELSGVPAAADDFERLAPADGELPLGRGRLLEAVAGAGAGAAGAARPWIGAGAYAGSSEWAKESMAIIGAKFGLRRWR